MLPMLIQVNRKGREEKKSKTEKGQVVIGSV
jgi:hypothetical protein